MMSSGKIVVTIKYENQAFMEVTQKVDDGANVTVLKIEENGHLDKTIREAQKYLEKHFSEVLNDVSAEMKKPAQEG